MDAAPPGAPDAGRAQRELAAALHLDPAQVLLTAGGSAANNLALSRARGHVISQPTEHPSVLRALEALEAGGVEVEFLPVDRRGAVAPAALARALRADTSLVALMHGNNETGCLQPIPALAAALRGHPARLHVDAVQTAPWFDVRPATLGADTVSVSFHKLGGPPGVGALLGRRPPAAPSLPLTPDVLAGVLAAWAARRPHVAAEVAASRDLLQAALAARVPGLTVHAADGPRLPGILSVSCAGVNGDALVLELEASGIAVGTGSACASGDPAPSHVLRALGVSAAAARASLRFSWESPLPEAVVERIVETYARGVERLSSLG